jgi:hypothetical protein
VFFWVLLMFFQCQYIGKPEGGAARRLSLSLLRKLFNVLTMFKV